MQIADCLPVSPLASRRRSTFATGQSPGRRSAASTHKLSVVDPSSDVHMSCARSLSISFSGSSLTPIEDVLVLRLEELDAPVTGGLWEVARYSRLSGGSPISVDVVPSVAVVGHERDIHGEEQQAPRLGHIQRTG